jgi:hypothetical protein
VRGKLTIKCALKQGLETRDRCGCACCAAASHGYVTLLGLGACGIVALRVLIIGTLSHVIADDRLPLFTFARSLFIQTPTHLALIHSFVLCFPAS